MTDREKLTAIRAEIERLMNHFDSEYDDDPTEVKAAKGNVCHMVLSFIDSMQEEPKFKVGDTIRLKNDGLEAKITNIDESGFVYAACEDWEQIIDPSKWEIVHRTKADVDAAMAEVEEKSKAFTEAHHGETAEEILAQMRGEEPVSKVWHDSCETPKDTKADIIIEGDVFNTKLFYACCTFESPFLKWEFVKRWAYIDDLLKL